MNIKAIAGVMAVLAVCGTSVAQTSNPVQNRKDQQTKKPLNEAQVEFQNRVIAASSAYKAGKTAESLAQFEQLYAENPSHKDVASWLGFIYLRMNQPDKAVPILEKATQLSPDDVEVWNNLGNAYMMSNAHEKALSAFQKVAEKRPDMFEPQYNIGTIFLNEKDYEQAIASFNRAAQLRSDDPFVQNNLGVAYEGHKDYSDAVRAFARASDLKQDSATFAKNAGFCYYRQRMYGQALPYLLKASSLDSSDQQVTLAISDSCMKTDRRQEAAKYYEMIAPSQGDNAPFWYNLGVLRMSLKNVSGAEQAYEKAIAINPNDLDSLNNLGILYFNEGKYSDSETTFDKLVGLSPTSLQSKVNLAAAACRAGDMDKATGVWKEVVQANPDRDDIRLDLANALWIAKDFDNAKYHFAEVLKRDPSNADAQNGMGLWYLENDRLPAAKTAFQASIHANAGNPLAYNNLAVTLERMNQRKQAIDLLEKAAKMAPDNQQISGNLKRMRAAGSSGQR